MERVSSETIFVFPPISLTLTPVAILILNYTTAEKICLEQSQNLCISMEVNLTLGSIK